MGQKTGKAFPSGILIGIIAAVILAVIAWIVLGEEFGIPILILAAICIVAAIAFRVLAGGRGGEADSTDGGIPKQPADDSRPLGDTGEAHDEVSPHDLPLDHPGRQKAEEMSEGSDDEGTTSGHDEGGAAGRGGSGDSDQVGSRESREGAEGGRD